MFSCGSARKAPLTPARAISFDSIVYFDKTGLDGVETPLTNVAARSLAHEGLHSEILLELEHLKERDAELETRLRMQRALKEEIESKVLSQRRHFERSMTEPQQGFVVKAAFAIGAVFASALVVLFVYKTRSSRL